MKGPSNPSISLGPHITIAPRGTEALVIGDASHMHRDLRSCVKQQRNDGGRTMQLILGRGEVSPVGLQILIPTSTIS